ncbi:MAG: homocysteine S-methyltransferase family protein [Planctomycetota bacterium]
MPLPDTDVLLLDGATGTELDRRGYRLGEPIWSAAALVDAADLIEQIHIDYLDAGAQAIVTNTFRTHARNIARDPRGLDAAELTKRAVDIAIRARDRINPDALVLGSVAPLEECYDPNQSPPRADCHAEHAQIIEQLLDAGVDTILIETMVTQHEAVAAAAEAQRAAPGNWMISFVLRSEDPPGRMLHGKPVLDVISEIDGALAVGVNCAAANTTAHHVSLLRQMLPEPIRVMAYANTDALDMATGRWIDGALPDADAFADSAMSWVDAGATIIGGCCGTTPEMIAAIACRLGR